MTIQGRNEAVLQGTAWDAPEWSHENHGVPFYRLTLSVPRLSGQRDLLPVLLRQELLDRFAAETASRGPNGFPETERPRAETGRGARSERNRCSPLYGTAPGQLPPPIRPGQPLRIEGQLRSFNNRSGVGRRLVLTIYARTLAAGDDTPQNTITLSGAVCKAPIYRRTPLGRSICDVMLAVPRRCGRADYLPVIAWGQLAGKVCTLPPGAPLSLEGRVQSRVYHKVTDTGVQERTAYEVSVMRLLNGDGCEPCGTVQGNRDS